MGTFRLFNHPIKRLYALLVIVEAALLAAAVYLGVHLRFGREVESATADAMPLWMRASVFVALIMLGMVATGLYNRRLRDGMPGVLVRLVLSFALGLVGMSVLFYMVPDLLLGRGTLAVSVLCGFAFLVMIRMFFLDLLGQRNINTRVLIIGAGRRAKPLTLLRRRSDLIGFNIVGFLPNAGDALAVPEDKRLYTDRSIDQLVDEMNVDVIVVAVDDRRNTLPMEDLLACRTRGVEVLDLMTFLEQETGKLKLDLMHPSWLAFSQGFRNGFLRGCVKRAFDVLISLSMLLVTLPLTLLTALIIWLESGSPILYRQVRVGENGKPFSLLKFRSMRADAEKDGKAQWARPGDSRVTRVGRFIRKYRIDELPQLLNVLRGDMSFVGPRPERPEFVSHLNEALPYYTERHRVKPGLTGWAQICYPYGASEKDAFEKLQFDLYYVKNHSLFLDLTVLLQTAEVVLWGKGAR